MAFGELVEPQGQAELPPTDHVARVLLKRGAREHAIELLRGAIARDPGERACAALLRAVEARPDASVYGPDLRLDLQLVETYAQRGWLVEALAVLRGAALDRTPEGQQRADVLEELLAPLPDEGDAELVSIDRQLRTGGATLALMSLDERIARGGTLPGWARRRHSLLAATLLDIGASSTPDIPVTHSSTPLGALLDPYLTARDLRSGLEAVRAYAASHREDHDAQAVVVALGRLVDAMAVVSAEVAAHVQRTQPMTGHQIALFQLQMGNLDVAERMFRKIVIEEPMDSLARERLDDILVVRASLSATEIIAPVSTMKDPWGPVDPLRETQMGGRLAPEVEPDGGVPPVRVASPSAPSAPSPRVTPSGAFRSPPERKAPSPSTAPLGEEPTRRVDADELRRELARGASVEDLVAAPTPASGAMARAETTAAPVVKRPPARHGRTDPGSPGALAKALEEDTREVHGSAPAPVPLSKKKTTSPELLKKVGTRSTGEGWVADERPPKSSDWEDVSTEIGDPDQMAELLLKQGFAERAIAIYERLVLLNPGRQRYATRLEEIREMIVRGAVPPQRTSPGRPKPDVPELVRDAPLGPEVTAQVALADMPELASTLPISEVPLTARVPKEVVADARARVDRIAPPLELDIVISDEPEPASPLAWGEEEVTAVGESPIEIEMPGEPAIVTAERVIDKRVRGSVAVHRIIRVS